MKSIKENNPFEQLLNWLKDGTLNYNMIQIAYRACIRQRKELPEGIKDLLGGSDERRTGLLYRMFENISQVIGCVELAYRRGYQAGQKSTKLKKAKK